MTTGEAIGDVLGLGATTVLIWQIAKWPLLGAVAVVTVALRYHFRPNVRQPHLRWLSPGAVVALVLWFSASVLFGLYVANFGRHDATYGSITGVIAFLVCGPRPAVAGAAHP